jgi:hypothetical protein
MEPIRPIGPRPQEIPAIEPVWREGEREQRQREQQKKRRQQQQPLRRVEPDEDDGLPHIDVSV